MQFLQIGWSRHFLVKTVMFFCMLFSSLAPNSAPLKRDGFVLIPIGGNAYVRSGVGIANVTRTNRLLTQNGIENWDNSENIIDIFFRTNKEGTIQLALELSAESDAVIRVSVFNKSTDVIISKGDNQFISIGKFPKKPPGYIKVSLEGISKKSGTFPSIASLGVSGTVVSGDINYIKNDFSFYFGRRGPSDHLNFELPADKDIEWFYNEVTIEEGQDVIGSYFMANGFAQGYFGIQVNSETERRILFSVWSPFTTDNPREIPEDKRVLLLRRGLDVKAGEFGGEGSGGQSYLIFPWKAGITYRFLNRVRPIDETHTMYTAYFYDPEKDSWRLVASFIRPQTSTWYKGAYSFLENFVPNQGQFERRGLYGNQWIRTKEGEWIEVTKARFTADATARAGARTDYQGGVFDNRFFLKNCGFFNETTPINTIFERRAIGIAPMIDFSKLP
ncbi:MAG: DUF3472 domain-containing protein [Holophagaceae bacterium]|nr:DUF3472 domain-containing protein [Holophagaceae bacterium]